MKYQKQFALYSQKNEKLMSAWAQEVRIWANAEDRVFYRDGIFDPETWFNSDFRPLFILKEVNERYSNKAIDEAKNHTESGEPITNCINYVAIGDKLGSDPWKEIDATTWRRLGILAYSMFEKIENGQNQIYIPEKLTANQHRDILRRIAVINLKKLGGGGSVDSDKSIGTLCFECHSSRFRDKIKTQIELINPTIIICCGKDSVIKALALSCQEKNPVFKTKNNTFIPVINGYHPGCRSSHEQKFYDTILKDNWNLISQN